MTVRVVPEGRGLCFEMLSSKFIYFSRSGFCFILADIIGAIEFIEILTYFDVFLLRKVEVSKICSLSM